ncbi:hypothetical protein DVH24_033201 [Malus domestica]|uniref:Pentatricopeptide repeat-containing protein n=1 Tax=Malus domestica TaxID=3750 RepID=A0A498JBU2_MALDO|nr:hypothetical protein DVH24_033201 [Malus domestica]
MISKELSPNWVTYATLLRVYGRAPYSDDALMACLRNRNGMARNGIGFFSRHSNRVHLKSGIGSLNLPESDPLDGGGIWIPGRRLFQESNFYTQTTPASSTSPFVPEKELELNVILYNTLLAMCADVGYTEEAVEIFEEMKSYETLNPDSWTFSSMITIYSCSVESHRGRSNIE